MTAEELSKLSLFGGADIGVLQRIAEQARIFGSKRASLRQTNESGRDLIASLLYANLLAPAPSQLMLLEPLTRNDRMYV